MILVLNWPWLCRVGLHEYTEDFFPERVTLPFGGFDECEVPGCGKVRAR